MSDKKTLDNSLSGLRNLSVKNNDSLAGLTKLSVTNGDFSLAGADKLAPNNADYSKKSLAGASNLKPEKINTFVSNNTSSTETKK